MGWPNRWTWFLMVCDIIGFSKFFFFYALGEVTSRDGHGIRRCRFWWIWMAGTSRPSLEVTRWISSSVGCPEVHSTADSRYIYIYNMICIYIHIFKQPFKHKMSFHPTATSRSFPPRLMSFPSQLPSVPVLLPCAGRQCWLWCCEEKEMKPHTMQRLLVEQTNSAPNWTAQFLLQLFEGWIFAWSSKFPTVEKSRWLLQSQSPCKVGACERAAQWAHASFLLSHFRWTLKVEKKRHRSARTTRKIHEAIDTWHYIYECSMFIHFTMIDRLNKYTFNYRLNQY